MDMLTEALDRLFRERVTPAVIREIEGGGEAAPLWNEISESGFLDILLPEEEGGAGVALSTAFESFMLAGLYALPVPFVQTVMVRSWLYAQGASRPDGAIAIAGPEASRQPGGRLQAIGVAGGKVADWVLGDFSGQWLLLPTAQAHVEGDATRGSQTADLVWETLPDGAQAFEEGRAAVCPPAQLGAAALAALLAGAGRRALDMTLEHVATRQQFGRPIAQFQAVQNQISLMAERVWAMRMAARMAFHAPAGYPSVSLAAIGKTRCSEAAAQVADIAHALHGAIGITEEYDLQLYTRRLREWRRAGGTEAWWARQLGREVMESQQGSVLDFIISCTQSDAA